jgi:hypothetical protein
LDFARERPNVLKHLPEERDWVHIDKVWLGDVLFTLETKDFQKFVEDAVRKRNQHVEQKQDLVVEMRPEFAEALKKCENFSCKFRFYDPIFRAQRKSCIPVEVKFKSQKNKEGNGRG